MCLKTKRITNHWFSCLRIWLTKPLQMIQAFFTHNTHHSAPMSRQVVIESTSRCVVSLERDEWTTENRYYPGKHSDLGGVEAPSTSLLCLSWNSSQLSRRQPETIAKLRATRWVPTIENLSQRLLFRHYIQIGGDQDSFCVSKTMNHLAAMLFVL